MLYIYDKRYNINNPTSFNCAVYLQWHYNISYVFPFGIQKWRFISRPMNLSIHGGIIIHEHYIDTARDLREAQFSLFGYLDAQAEIRASLNLNTRDCKLRTLTRRCEEQSSSPHIPLDGPLTATACALIPNTLRDPSHRAFPAAPALCPPKLTRYLPYYEPSGGVNALTRPLLAWNKFSSRTTGIPMAKLAYYDIIRYEI